MPSKKYAEVHKTDCVACGTCIAVCPREAISVYRGCYAQVDSALCVGCGKCGKVCPVDCISLVEREGAK